MASKYFTLTVPLLIPSPACLQYVCGSAANADVGQERLENRGSARKFEYISVPTPGSQCEASCCVHARSLRFLYSARYSRHMSGEQTTTVIRIHKNQVCCQLEATCDTCDKAVQRSWFSCHSCRGRRGLPQPVVNATIWILGGSCQIAYQSSTAICLAHIWIAALQT